MSELAAKLQKAITSRRYTQISDALTDYLTAKGENRTTPEDDLEISNLLAIYDTEHRHNFKIASNAHKRALTTDPDTDTIVALKEALSAMQEDERQKTGTVCDPATFTIFQQCVDKYFKNGDENGHNMQLLKLLIDYGIQLPQHNIHISINNIALALIATRTSYNDDFLSKSETIVTTMLDKGFKPDEGTLSQLVRMRLLAHNKLIQLGTKILSAAPSIGVDDARSMLEHCRYGLHTITKAETFDPEAFEAICQRIEATMVLHKASGCSSNDYLWISEQKAILRFFLCTQKHNPHITQKAGTFVPTILHDGCAEEVFTFAANLAILQGSKVTLTPSLQDNTMIDNILDRCPEQAIVGTTLHAMRCKHTLERVLGGPYCNIVANNDDIITYLNTQTYSGVMMLMQQRSKRFSSQDDARILFGIFLNDYYKYDKKEIKDCIITILKAMLDLGLSDNVDVIKLLIKKLLDNPQITMPMLHELCQQEHQKLQEAAGGGGAEAAGGSGAEAADSTDKAAACGGGAAADARAGDLLATLQDIIALPAPADPQSDITEKLMNKLYSSTLPKLIDPKCEFKAEHLKVKLLVQTITLISSGVSANHCDLKEIKQQAEESGGLLKLLWANRTRSDDFNMLNARDTKLEYLVLRAIEEYQKNTGPEARIHALEAEVQRLQDEAAEVPVALPAQPPTLPSAPEIPPNGAYAVAAGVHAATLTAPPMPVYAAIASAPPSDLVVAAAATPTAQLMTPGADESNKLTSFKS